MVTVYVLVLADFLHMSSIIVLHCFLSTVYFKRRKNLCNRRIIIIELANILCYAHYNVTLKDTWIHGIVMYTVYFIYIWVYALITMMRFWIVTNWNMSLHHESKPPTTCTCTNSMTLAYCQNKMTLRELSANNCLIIIMYTL